MRLEKTFRFEAAHHLPRVPAGHKCGRVHGHSYHVTLVVEGDVDPVMGWVMDFADITRAWEPLGALLDHYHLNTVEGLENPTSENLAVWVFWRAKVALPLLTEVVVSETCTSRIVYRPVTGAWV